MGRIREALIDLKEYKEDGDILGKLKPILDKRTGMPLDRQPIKVEAKPTVGVIYVAFNPYIRTPQGDALSKIGYTDIDDAGELKRNLNNPSVPGRFTFYAKWGTTERLSDLYLHKLIDEINPNLREDPNREFYLLTPEQATAMLDRIAQHADNIKQRDIKSKEAQNMRKSSAENNKQAAQRSKNATNGRKTSLLSFMNPGDELQFDDGDNKHISAINQSPIKVNADGEIEWNNQTFQSVTGLRNYLINQVTGDKNHHNKKALDTFFYDGKPLRYYVNELSSNQE